MEEGEFTLLHVWFYFLWNIYHEIFSKIRTKNCKKKWSNMSLWKQSELRSPPGSLLHWRAGCTGGHLPVGQLHLDGLACIGKKIKGNKFLNGKGKHGSLYVMFCIGKVIPAVFSFYNKIDSWFGLGRGCCNRRGTINTPTLHVHCSCPIFFVRDDDEDKEGNRTQLISAFSWNLLNYFRDFSSAMYNLVLKNIMAKEMRKSEILIFNWKYVWAEFWRFVCSLRKTTNFGLFGQLKNFNLPICIDPSSPKSNSDTIAFQSAHPTDGPSQ